MKLKDVLINNLKFYRKQKGMTQNDLTLALNKSYNYINSVEQGKMLPSFEAIEQICAALEIQPAQLFDDGASPANVRAFDREQYVAQLTDTLLAKLQPVVAAEIKATLKERDAR